MRGVFESLHGAVVKLYHSDWSYLSVTGWKGFAGGLEVERVRAA